MNKQSDKLIYLASPYSHSDASVRKERFTAICTVAARLMSKGVFLFCPIAHTHPIAESENKLPGGWEYWRDYDRLMLSKCSELWIVELEGWDKSDGIRGEIKIAIELGLIIRRVDPQTCYISGQVFTV